MHMIRCVARIIPEFQCETMSKPWVKLWVNFDRGLGVEIVRIWVPIICLIYRGMNESVVNEKLLGLEGNESGGVSIMLSDPREHLIKGGD